MDAVFALLFAVCLIAAGGLGAATLRIRGLAAWVAAAGVLAAAVAVGGSIALSAGHAWTRGWMLAVLAVAALAAAAIWLRTGRPRPPALPPRPALRALGGPVLVLAGLAGLTLVVQLYVGARVAPNNWDSMTYHLSRAAYWLQEASVGQFPGASVRQAASAPNGEILQGLTMMATGTDRWVESVQWLALVGIALLVFEAARLLRFSAGESAFAASLFVVLPQPVMQAASTQNDLVVGFFVAATGLFAVRGLRDRHAGDMAVAAVALGVAVGTKGTAFFAGVALAIVVLAAVVAYRPRPRFVAFSLAAALVAIAALGSYNYVLNAKNRGSVLGGVQAQTALPAGADRGANAVQDLWTFADSPGLGGPWLEAPARAAGELVFGPLAPPGFAFAIDTGTQEDTSAFGLVGLLLLPLVLLAALVGRRSPPSRRVLAGAVLTSLVAFGLLVAFNPWLGRLLIPAVALAAPLFGLLARRPAVAGAIVVVAALSLMPALLQNPQKVLVAPGEPDNVFAMERLGQIIIPRPDMGPVFAAVERRAGPDGDILFAGGEDSWDYPLFGPHRTRRVVREDNKYAVTMERMRAEGVAGALFADVGPPPPGLEATKVGPDYWWVAADRS